VADNVADDRDRRAVGAVGEQVEVAGDAEFGGDKGGTGVDAGELRDRGRGQRRPDRLQFLGAVLERAQAAGEGGREERGSDEKGRADRGGEGEVGDGMDRAPDRVEGQAPERRKEPDAAPKPSGGEPDRYRVEEGDAAGGAGNRQPENEDDQRRKDDPGDAGGSSAP